METIYDVDYFIKKFEAIPEIKLVNYNFRAPYDYSQRCFMGHCLPDAAVDLILDFGPDADGACAAPREYFNLPMFDESRALTLLFYRHFGMPTPRDATHLIYLVNNGDHPKYQQRTTKQRILAALYDIKKAQELEVKERIVYVTVDHPVRELQKKEPALN